jgi:hypothetical protein
MRITRKIRPAADLSDHVDTDTMFSPSIVRLGTIAELVKGRAGTAADGVIHNWRHW